jgi:hypothetical protein
MASAAASPSIPVNEPFALVDRLAATEAIMRARGNSEVADLLAAIRSGSPFSEIATAIGEMGGEDRNSGRARRDRNTIYTKLGEMSGCSGASELAAAVLHLVDHYASTRWHEDQRRKRSELPPDDPRRLLLHDLLASGVRRLGYSALRQEIFGGGR